MGIAPEPKMEQRLAEFGRHVLRRHQPRHAVTSGKARRVAVADPLAGPRPQPVGGDERNAALVPRPPLSARRNRDAVGMSDEILHAHAEFDGDVELPATAPLQNAACRSPR